MSKQTGGVIAGLRSNPTLALMIGILAVSLFVVVLAGYQIQQHNAHVQRFLRQSEDLRATSYRLVDALRTAMTGNELSFEDMNETLTDMTELWGELDSPENKALLDSMPDQAATVRADARSVAWRAASCARWSASSSVISGPGSARRISSMVRIASSNRRSLS